MVWLVYRCGCTNAGYFFFVFARSSAMAFRWRMSHVTTGRAARAAIRDPGAHATASSAQDDVLELFDYRFERQSERGPKRRAGERVRQEPGDVVVSPVVAPATEAE